MDGQTDGWPLLLYPSPLSRGDNKKETSLELTLLNILLELSMILQSRGANWLLQISPNKPWSLLSFFVISSNCCQQVKVENKDQCSRLKKIIKQSKCTGTFKNSYLIIFEKFNFTITLLHSLILSPTSNSIETWHGWWQICTLLFYIKC